MAEFYLNDRRKNGVDPIDWRMVNVLDGVCSQFIDKLPASERRIMDDAFRDYAETFRAADSSSPEEFRRRLKQAEDEAKAKDAEIARLRSQQAAATSSNSLPLRAVARIMEAESAAEKLGAENKRLKEELAELRRSLPPAAKSVTPTVHDEQTEPSYKSANKQFSSPPAHKEPPGAPEPTEKGQPGDNAAFADDHPR